MMLELLQRGRRRRDRRRDRRPVRRPIPRPRPPVIGFEILLILIILVLGLAAIA